MGGQVLEYVWETEYRRQLKEAEELEEDDIEYIQHICEVAAKYAPDYDADRIYEELYPESENE